MPASESTNQLLNRAMKAMQAGRITRPVGDNAVDLFVTLHGREPGNEAVKAALVELQPYMLLASERAIAGGDVEDAERLIGAMAMFNPTAAPLPRLRVSLEEVQRRPTDEATGAADQTDAGADTVPRDHPATTAAGPRPMTADTVPTAAAPATPAASAAPVPTLVATMPPTPIEPAAAPVPPPPVPPVVEKAPPLLVRDVAPEYPLSAMRRGLSGRVRLEFTVRPDGGVADVMVVEAIPEGVFDEAAVAAARQWRFEPLDAPATSARELRFDIPRS